jgi:MOSC domain-containing protein YiiM
MAICDICEFDADRWSDRDVRTSVPAVPVLWELHLRGLPAATLDEPFAGAASINERVARTEAALAGLGKDAPRDAVLAVLHEAFHDMHLVGRQRAALGCAAPRQTGRVARLHRSDGGVPKSAVDEVDVDWSGVVGDVQNDRKHHGRPFQALCLWSVEVIEKLQAEGHPIQPGFAGENITITGLDWSSLPFGTMLRIGEVDAEIAAHAIPCAKNAAWFADRNYNRIHHDEHPGDSRLYAWVRGPGRIAVGDTVVVEP